MRKEVEASQLDSSVDLAVVRSGVTENSVVVRALRVVGDRQITHILEAKLWLRCVHESAHLNPRLVIQSESRRTSWEIFEEELLLRKIILFFREEGVRVPCQWLRITSPTTLAATAQRLRSS